MQRSEFKSTPITKLPEPLVAQALSYSSLRDFFAQARVSKGFFSAGKRENVLRELYNRHFGVLPFEMDLQPQLMAAYLYHRGLDSLDDKEGRKFFVKLHEFLKKHKGKSWTIFYLGVMALRGLDSEKNKNKNAGLQFLYQALEAGDYRAAELLYFCARSTNEFESISLAEEKVDLTSCLLKSVEKGNHTAVQLVGNIYRLGIGISPDEKKATEYLEQALYQYSDTDAAQDLVQLHLKTSKVELAKQENFERALQFLEVAFEKMESRAIAFLAARICEDRAEHFAIQNNHEKEMHAHYRRARRWYLYAFILGSGEAAKNVGTYYLRGYGVKADSEKAKRWMTRAFKQGHVEAASVIAFAMEADEMLGDLLEKESWYKKAALAGSNMSLMTVAQNCQSSENWQDDLAKVWWVLFAAIEGNEIFDKSLQEIPFASAVLNDIRGVDEELEVSSEEMEMFTKVGKQEGLVNAEMAARLDRLYAQVVVMEKRMRLGARS
jgi:TPR repeat protein